RRVRSAWPEAHAGNAEILQLAGGRQTFAYHYINGKIKLLHEAPNGNGLNNTHWVDSIRPCVPIGNSATNSLRELRLFIARSKSQRVSPSVDHQGNSHRVA